MSWWRARSTASSNRWVVLDVETTGLDTSRDRLLAIAGVAVHVDSGALRIAIADSFETMLHQPQPTLDRDNILLHGIGIGEQAEGVAPREALDAFEHWCAGAPWIGFHVAFDEAMLRRARREAGGDEPRHASLDLSPLAQVLHPRAAERSLDDWTARFGIVNTRRHQAAADALATAELLLALWPGARRHAAAPDFATLRRIAARQRWLPPN